MHTLMLKTTRSAHQSFEDFTIDDSEVTDRTVASSNPPKPVKNPRPDGLNPHFLQFLAVVLASVLVLRVVDSESTDVRRPTEQADSP